MEDYITSCLVVNCKVYKYFLLSVIYTITRVRIKYLFCIGNFTFRLADRIVSKLTSPRTTFDSLVLDILRSLKGKRVFW